MTKQKIRTLKVFMYIIAMILILAGVISVLAYPEGITFNAFSDNAEFFLTSIFLIIIAINWKKKEIN